MIIADRDDKDFDNPDLKSSVEKTTPMKEWLVDYVGKNFQAEVGRFKVESGKEYDWDGSVTVEMIIDLMAKEFPEFVMAVAEENFIRGYRQALADVDTGKELADAENEQENNS